MSCEHNHRPTEYFLSLPPEEQLQYLKRIKARMISRDDTSLLGCIEYDIAETEQKINEQH